MNKTTPQAFFIFSATQVVSPFRSGFLVAIGSTFFKEAPSTILTSWNMDEYDMIHEETSGIYEEMDILGCRHIKYHWFRGFQLFSCICSTIICLIVWRDCFLTSGSLVVGCEPLGIPPNINTMSTKIQGSLRQSASWSVRNSGETKGGGSSLDIWDLQMAWRFNLQGALQMMFVCYVFLKGIIC